MYICMYKYMYGYSHKPENPRTPAFSVERCRCGLEAARLMHLVPEGSERGPATKQMKCYYW